MVDRGTFSKMHHDLSFVDETVRTFAPVQQPRTLPRDFQPNPWTVICGRGKGTYNNIGNRRFRILCELNEVKYEQATTKTQKSLIVMNIVDAIRSGCGGFVKQDNFTKEWFEVSDAVAREKVGQQIRENLAKKKQQMHVAKQKLKSARAKKDAINRSRDNPSHQFQPVGLQTTELLSVSKQQYLPQSHTLDLPSVKKAQCTKTPSFKESGGMRGSLSALPELINVDRAKEEVESDIEDDNGSVAEVEELLWETRGKRVSTSERDEDTALGSALESIEGDLSSLAEPTSE